MTPLEEATLTAATVLRDGRFGAALQRFDPRRRAAEDLDPNSFASMENGKGPALHRTEWLTEFVEQTDVKPHVTAFDVEYLKWWQPALRAVAAIAGLCWGEVPRDLRVAVMDEDDLGALHSKYIPDSRDDVEGHRALRFENLDRGDAATALAELERAVQDTESYRHARDTMAALRRHGGLRALRKLRRRIERVLDTTALPLDEARRFGRELIQETYAGAPGPVADAARAVQAHNELVNHILWTMLGIAEDEYAPTILEEDVSPVRLCPSGRIEDVRVTLRSLGFAGLGSPPAPFVLLAGLPVDGVYLCRQQLTQWSREVYTDVAGRRLGALERAS